MVVFLRMMLNLLASSLFHPQSVTVLDSSTGTVVGHLSPKELAAYPALRTAEIDGVRRYLAGLAVAPESEALPVLVEDEKLKILAQNVEEGEAYPVRYRNHAYIVRFEAALTTMLSVRSKKVVLSLEDDEFAPGQWREIHEHIPLALRPFLKERVLLVHNKGNGEWEIVEKST